MILPNSNITIVPSCFDSFKIIFLENNLNFGYCVMYLKTLLRVKYLKVFDSQNTVFIRSEALKTQNYYTHRQPRCLQSKMTTGRFENRYPPKKLWIRP